MSEKRKTRSSGSAKSDGKAPGEDGGVNHAVLGGMKGGYRIDGESNALDDGVEQFKIPFNDKQIICERRGKGTPSLIFTHGAGGGLDNPATKEFADGFAEIAPVVSFQGTMNLQSRIKTYHAVMDHLNFDAALGGRSMGARSAAISSHEEGRQTKALVLVSFPLIGGKNKESREQILLDLPEHLDVLFITGDHDGMCDLQMLERVVEKVKATCWFATVEGTDHSMSWKHKDSVELMRRKTGAVAAEWLKDRSRDKRYCTIYYDEEAQEVLCDDWHEKAISTEDATTGAEPPAKKRKNGKGSKKRQL